MTSNISIIEHAHKSLALTVYDTKWYVFSGARHGTRVACSCARGILSHSGLYAAPSVSSVICARSDVCTLRRSTRRDRRHAQDPEQRKICHARRACAADGCDAGLRAGPRRVEAPGRGMRAREGFRSRPFSMLTTGARAQTPPPLCRYSARNRLRSSAARLARRPSSSGILRRAISMATWPCGTWKTRRRPCL